MYRDGAARKVLGDRDFVFGDELTRDNLLKIAVTADELREANVYKVCVQPLDGSEFTVHVDVAACRISDLKSQIRAKNGMCPSEQLLYLISSSTFRLAHPTKRNLKRNWNFFGFFKLHHLANWMHHQLEENEAKRSSLLPFEAS